MTIEELEVAREFYVGLMKGHHLLVGELLPVWWCQLPEQPLMEREIFVEPRCVGCLIGTKLGLIEDPKSSWGWLPNAQSIELVDYCTSLATLKPLEQTFKTDGPAL